MPTPQAILQHAESMNPPPLPPIPVVQWGNVYFFVFNECQIPVQDTLKLTPILDSSGAFTSKYLVNMIDFSSTNAFVGSV